MVENVQLFRICIYSCKKCYYDQKNSVKNTNINNAEFYTDLEFVDAGFQNCSLKKLKEKHQEKM
jgi:hypothetical protein